MKLLKFLVIVALLLLPFGEILRIELHNNIALRPLDLVVGLTALWWFLFSLRKKKAFLPKPFIIFAVIGLFSLVINSSWLKPNELLTAFLYVVRWVSYAAMFMIVSQVDAGFKKKITFFLFLDGVILLLLGFLQYFFYNSLKGMYYLGWDEHMHRMFSTFLDPNFAGAFFVLFFLFVGGLFFSFVKNKRDSGVAMLPRMTKIFGLGFILASTLLAIFLTFSRAAFLMLIVGSIIFLTLIHKKKLVFLLLGIIILFGIIISPKFHDENMNLFRETSSKARLDNYSLALKIIQDRPLGGVGFNTYRYAKPLYGVREGGFGAFSHADAGVDNSFLFVLATTGIIGFTAYCWLWLGIIKRAYDLNKKKENIFAIVVISSVIGLFINALFINSLFFPVIMLWMWILIAL